MAGEKNDGVTAVRRGGRPTREEAALRDIRLLEVATRLFMEHGYEGTSMDAVAEAAGVGKPTLYSRYRDKRDLFEAVLTARINDWLLPIAQVAEGEGGKAPSGDLEAVLDEISRAMLRHMLKPGAGALQRVIAAQKLKFPELARFAYEQGWVRAVESVADILRSFAAQGSVHVPDTKLAAEIFLNLIIAPTSRAALYGVEVDPERQEERRAASVRFFLRGLGAPVSSA
ncbi:TetR/AcrR family transcriptional regulator [Rhodoblastus sp. 17X3]|uniref:TetR/AcrR family transcriptional regulator n=1 Tax=Rhodoblastus sp. 17X3 TaxID=3047026 RepID=UPI0024B765E3|nr:TetR/AcrR family transcriptional regulator [Rhodoblastus sp. 17X3]MDI9849633.1 TetR/AcrR family transcriptional regulator [Rhodoblastus sp. 17X3]